MKATKQNYKNMKNEGNRPLPKEINDSLTTMEKALVTHSSTLSWRISRKEKPGRLQSMGSLRVEHDRETSLSLFIFTCWTRKWHPLPCSCLENPRDGGGLVGCHPRGRTELDTTDAT